MKPILTGFLCCMLQLAANGQTYTLTTMMSCKSGWSPELNYDFGSVSANSGKFIIDIDQKTFTYNHTTEPIKNIAYNASTRTYTLRMKDGGAEVKWTLYYLPIGEDGKPLYIQRAQRYTGSDFKKDTFFVTYTNDLSCLKWSELFYRTKEEVDLSRNPDSAAVQAIAIYQRATKSEQNVFTMQNGIVYKTIKEKGKPDVTENFDITEARVSDGKGIEGLEIFCQTRDILPRHYRILYGKAIKSYSIGMKKYDKVLIMIEQVFGMDYAINMFLD